MTCQARTEGAERPLSHFLPLGTAAGKFSGHGFRSTASTLLHELGWRSDVIERQLAHAERDKVKAAYNHAEYLPERREMMQAWSDWIDELAKKAAEKERNPV